MSGCARVWLKRDWTSDRRDSHVFSHMRLSMHCPWTCYISVDVFYKSRCSSKRMLFHDCIMCSSFFRAILILFTFKLASKIYSDTPRSPPIWCSLKRTKTSLYATESKLQGHCHVPYLLSIRGPPTPEGPLVFKESRINTFSPFFPLLST